MSFKDILDRHHTHQVVIIPRFVRGRPQLVPGLYCEDCSKLIKWLNPQVADELASVDGVEQLQARKQDQIKLFQQQLMRKYSVDSETKG